MRHLLLHKHNPIVTALDTILVQSRFAETRFAETLTLTLTTNPKTPNP